jgi:phage shock protein A
LVDYGNNVEEAKNIRDQIAQLQQTYQNLIDESAKIRRKVQKTHLIAQMQNVPV